jgi:hypothetical protein
MLSTACESVRRGVEAPDVVLGHCFAEFAEDSINSSSQRDFLAHLPCQVVARNNAGKIMHFQLEGGGQRRGYVRRGEEGAP